MLSYQYIYQNKSVLIYICAHIFILYWRRNKLCACVWGICHFHRKPVPLIYVCLSAPGKHTVAVICVLHKFCSITALSSVIKLLLKQHRVICQCHIWLTIYSCSKQTLDKNAWLWESPVLQHNKITNSSIRKLKWELLSLTNPLDFLAFDKMWIADWVISCSAPLGVT